MLFLYDLITGHSLVYVPPPIPIHATAHSYTFFVYLPLFGNIQN